MKKCKELQKEKIFPTKIRMRNYILAFIDLQITVMSVKWQWLFLTFCHLIDFYFLFEVISLRIPRFSEMSSLIFGELAKISTLIVIVLLVCLSINLHSTRFDFYSWSSKVILTRHSLSSSETSILIKNSSSKLSLCVWNTIEK